MYEPFSRESPGIGPEESCILKEKRGVGVGVGGVNNVAFGLVLLKSCGWYNRWGMMLACVCACVRAFDAPHAAAMELSRCNIAPEENLTKNNGGRISRKQPVCWQKRKNLKGVDRKAGYLVVWYAGVVYKSLL